MKMCDTYTMKYLFSYKKEWDLAICDNIDRPSIMLSEITQRKSYTIWFHFCMESKKLNY